MDERGEPVPGAAVLASWPVERRAPGHGAAGAARRSPGRRGEFLIAGVVAGVPSVLSAVAPDGRRTTRSVESQAGAEPARLVLDSSGSVSLAGRVVDASGRRVAGARVHIRVQARYPGGRQSRATPLVEIRGAYAIRTRDNGWFRTPTILDPDLQVRRAGRGRRVRAGADRLGRR